MLITVSKTVGRRNRTAHAALFLAMMIGFLIFNFRKKSFNYDRVWMWYLLGIGGVIWTALLATVNMFTASHLAYLISLVTGYLVLVITGLMLQLRRFPALLY
jgi:hypothetical protein